MPGPKLSKFVIKVCHLFYTMRDLGYFQSGLEEDDVLFYLEMVYSILLARRLVLEGRVDLEGDMTQLCAYLVYRSAIECSETCDEFGIVIFLSAFARFPSEMDFQRAYLESLPWPQLEFCAFSPAIPSSEICHFLGLLLTQMPYESEFDRLLQQCNPRMYLEMKLHHYLQDTWSLHGAIKLKHEFRCHALCKWLKNGGKSAYDAIFNARAFMRFLVFLSNLHLNIQTEQEVRVNWEFLKTLIKAQPGHYFPLPELSKKGTPSVEILQQHAQHYVTDVGDGELMVIHSSLRKSLKQAMGVVKAFRQDGLQPERYFPHLHVILQVYVSQTQP